MKTEKLLILVDTEYVQDVVSDMQRHFGQQLGYPIPAADLAYWLDCVALDAGLRPGANSIQVGFVHPKSSSTLQGFVPSSYAEELDGKAFSDNLGEFALQSLPVEDIVSKDQFLLDCVEELSREKDAPAIIVVAPSISTEAPHTLCTMQPDTQHVSENGMAPIQLGFSLLAALGITHDQL
ncbi:MAG: hypothetical protein MJZ40_02850 [Bacteroidaceae bacterium]|nr:hypothetical protein [Bacteroidaceae bacterium]